MNRDEIIEDLWYAEFVHNGLCGLCGNTGVINTDSLSSPAGTPCGGRFFCICPNGRCVKKRADHRGVTVETTKAMIEKTQSSKVTGMFLNGKPIEQFSKTRVPKDGDRIEYHLLSNVHGLWNRIINHTNRDEWNWCEPETWLCNCTETNGPIISLEFIYKETGHNPTVGLRAEASKPVAMWQKIKVFETADLSILPNAFTRISGQSGREQLNSCRA